jgi:hypothetical protein
LDTLGADIVFHGHAHHGSLEGVTPGGIPVRNVSLPLLREHKLPFVVWSVPAKERRRESEPVGRRSG